MAVSARHLRRVRGARALGGVATALYACRADGKRGSTGQGPLFWVRLSPMSARLGSSDGRGGLLLFPCRSHVAALMAAKCRDGGAGRGRVDAHDARRRLICPRNCGGGPAKELLHRQHISRRACCWLQWRRSRSSLADITLMVSSQRTTASRLCPPNYRRTWRSGSNNRRDGKEVHFPLPLGAVAAASSCRSIRSRDRMARAPSVTRPSQPTRGPSKEQLGWLESFADGGLDRPPPRLMKRAVALGQATASRCSSGYWGGQRCLGLLLAAGPSEPSALRQ